MPHQQQQEQQQQGPQDPSQGKGPKMLNDAEEGRTIFVRQLAFSSTEEEVSAYFSEQCGPVQQCKIVRDKLTEHSRGQAFVKFRRKADADACLLRWANSPDGACYTLQGRQLSVCLAVSKDKLGEVRASTNASASSLPAQRAAAGGKRNLHLAAVGQLRRGSQEAAGVPEAELAMREQLEARARQALKNPDVFVSPTRLCVHNLPPELADRELRLVFKRLGGEGARVTECRIMRDTSKAEQLAAGAKVAGRSRGFAFVAYGDHEHALRAVHAAAAGPVLPQGYRPRRLIVQFSLERLAALKRRQLRQERRQQQQEVEVPHAPRPEGASSGLPKAPKRRAKREAARRLQLKEERRQRRQQQLMGQSKRLSRSEFRRRRKEKLISEGRIRA